jgi:prepilin-type processing-associated H-X9-DG protein
VRWIDPPHAGNHLVVQVFTCPIDAYANTPQTQPNFLPGYQVSLTSYQGVAGLDFENRNGVLFRNSQIRFADIGDGTSNTLLIGERPPVFNGRWYGIWYRDSGTYFEGTLGVVMGVREKNRMVVTVGSCPPGYYKFSPGRLGDPCDVFHFWSFHSGGANFAFCDGTVRFLGYEKTGIMSALASRNGGDNALE